MELLIIILIVIFITANGRKKNGRTDGSSAAKTASRATGAAGATRATRSNAAAQSRAALRQKLQMNRDDLAKALSGLTSEAGAQAAKAPAEVKPVQVAGQRSPVFMAASAPLGASILDEEGCVGGSMEHTHEEGESRREHEHHVREARQREARETLAAQAAMEISDMNLRRLRQAVVMAEVLDRPKALRRRAG